MSRRIAKVVIAGLVFTLIGTPAQASTINLTLNCSSSVSARNQYVTGGDVLVYTVTNADQINDRWPAGTSYLLVSGGSTVASGTISVDTSTTFSSLTTSSTYTLTVTLPSPIPSSFVSSSMNPDGVSGGKSGTNCSRNSNTVNNVIYFVNDPSMNAGSSPSSPSQADIDAQAAAARAKAEAAHAAAVAVAKTTLVDTLRSGKPITANDLNSADFNIASAKAAARVATQLLALPEAQRTDLAKIQSIVRTENFIEKVSTPDTHSQVTSQELIQQNLLNADYKYKSTVVRALIAADPASLTSLDKMAAVVKAAQATVQARKDRLAATVARINSRK